MDQGFSLTEVLVSLLLMTTTSLALLKQQWQVTQLFNQAHTRAHALLQLDNAAERLHVGHNLIPALRPFNLRYTRTAQTENIFMPPAPLPLPVNHPYEPLRQYIIHVHITWEPLSLSTQSCCTMERQLVVEVGDE